MVTKKITAGGIRCTRLRIFSAIEMSSVTDSAMPGKTLAMTMMEAMNRSVRQMPGMMPPTKSWPIEVLVSAPKMIRLTLGGIRIPRVAPAAMLPSTSFSL